jgi:hypothetical protein
MINYRTAGAGYTLLSQVSTLTTCLEYKKVTATGTYNPGMTYGATSTTQVATIALKLQ